MIEIQVTVSLLDTGHTFHAARFSGVLTDLATGRGFSCQGQKTDGSDGLFKLRLEFTLSNPSLEDLSGPRLLLWTEHGEFPVTIIVGSYRALQRQDSRVTPNPSCQRLEEYMPDFLEHYRPDGFFYETRNMNFCADLADKLVDQLVYVESMTKTTEDYISVMQLIWKFPFTMAMYKDRCIKNGALEGQYDEYLRRVYQIVERIVESHKGSASS